MMITIELNKKEVFDRIWRWYVKYLQQQDGSRPAFILPAGGFKKLRHSLGLVATTASVLLINKDKNAIDFVRVLWNAN